jgi:hypothetical protein
MTMMLRWLLAVFVVLLLFGRLQHYLEKIGLGRLPGDIRFTLWGRSFFLPFASSALISVLVVLVGKFI